ncbi:unnamed protein product, partial [Didymodactylos carnosus]
MLRTPVLVSSLTKYLIRFASSSAITKADLGALSSSISSDDTNIQTPQNIAVALCIQRYPHLSPEMSKLESDYSDLIEKSETAESYLSDHELRIKRELQTTQQKPKEIATSTTKSPSTSAAIAVETAQDFEDKMNKEFKQFQFALRQTDDDKTNNIKSQNRKLDQNLLLIVQRKNEKNGKDEWIFPQKLYEGEKSLRMTADQVPSICGNLNVQILGNAPWAWYKSSDKTDPIK